MTSSIGSVSGFQPHEWISSSPAERMATSGHTRGSSGDGQLINLGEPDMKRTQSNSSLSDHSRWSISVFLYKLHSRREHHSTECCMKSSIIKVRNCLFVTWDVYSATCSWKSFYFSVCNVTTIYHIYPYIVYTNFADKRRSLGRYSSLAD
jgi:hypothetical protein